MAGQSRHVGIVGCGIAGLATGIGMRKAGCEITIIEKRTQIEEVCRTRQVLFVSAILRYPLMKYADRCWNPAIT